jgi:hypothetical protein
MHFRLTLAGAVAAVLAAPAAAFAVDAVPSIAPLGKCYVAATPAQREPVSIQAVGFPASAVVDVFVDDIFQSVPAGTPPPTADGLGMLKGSVPAPYVDVGQRLFTVRLTEHRNDGTAGATASQTSKVTALTASQSPQVPSTTSSRVRFRGRGFTDRTKPIYAHYVLHGQERQTVLIGKPFGDCGQFSVRRRQFPFNNPRTGNWWVQFDQEQAYNPQARTFTRLKIVVKKVRKQAP